MKGLTYFSRNFQNSSFDKKMSKESDFHSKFKRGKNDARIAQPIG